MDPASDGEREPADPTAADDALVSISIDNNAPPAPATPVRFFLWIIYLFIFEIDNNDKSLCNLCNSAMVLFSIAFFSRPFPLPPLMIKKTAVHSIDLLTIDI
jgi:hypothetical protein